MSGRARNGTESQAARALERAPVRGLAMPRTIPAAGPHLAFRELAAFRHELRLFLQASDGAARRLGLEPQQYHLLLAIKARESDADTNIKDLADELLLRHHSVVELIDRSEAHGLVERHRQAGDRRKVSVILTKKGSARWRRWRRGTPRRCARRGGGCRRRWRRRWAGRRRRRNAPPGRASMPGRARTGPGRMQRHVAGRSGHARGG